MLFLNFEDKTQILLLYTKKNFSPQTKQKNIDLGGKTHDWEPCSGNTLTKASTADTGWRKFFLSKAGQGKEVDSKLFIISGEREPNISKHVFSFYAGVFLCDFIIGE